MSNTPPPQPHRSKKRNKQVAPAIEPISSYSDNHGDNGQHYDYNGGMEPVGSGYNVPRSSHEYEGSPNTRSYESANGQNFMKDKPETTIGKTVSATGELSFKRLLRIDGSFEGKLTSPGGNLILGKSGKLIGNVENMGVCLIDGQVIGNISVERCELRGHASVHGDITCKSLRLDPGVIVVGRLNVNPHAPAEIDVDGNVLGKSEDEVDEEQEDEGEEPPPEDSKEDGSVDENPEMEEET